MVAILVIELRGKSLLGWFSDAIVHLVLLIARIFFHGMEKIYDFYTSFRIFSEFCNKFLSCSNNYLDRYIFIEKFLWKIIVNY